MLRCDTPCGLLLSVTQVVEAQGASNYSRRIFDAFQSHKRNEISPTVFAGIDLQPPETVLAEAALDDPAPVASWAEIRFGLDGWTEARRSLHSWATPSVSVCCACRRRRSNHFGRTVS